MRRSTARRAGRFGGRMRGAPVLLLTVKGRKSGKRRTTPLIYGRDGDNLVIVASLGGARHPARQPPRRRQVQIGGEHFRVRARDAEGEERERLWSRWSVSIAGMRGTRRRRRGRSRWSCSSAPSLRSASRTPPAGSSRPPRRATSEQPAEARGDHLSRRRCGRPGPDAAAARDELADRLVPLAGLDRLFAAFVGMTAHERLADEARHLVAGERPGGLEGRSAQHREVERRVALRVAAEQAADRPAAARPPANVLMIAA